MEVYVVWVESSDMSGGWIPTVHSDFKSAEETAMGIDEYLVEREGFECTYSNLDKMNGNSYLGLIYTAVYRNNDGIIAHLKMMHAVAN